MAISVKAIGCLLLSKLAKKETSFYFVYVFFLVSYGLVKVKGFQFADAHKKKKAEVKSQSQKESLHDLYLILEAHHREKSN